MLERLFEAHGRFCASHPAEVIFTTCVILTACLLTADTGNAAREGHLPVSPAHCYHGRCNSEDVNAPDVILMTIIRCLAILFCYYQFRNLQNLKSKYILGIAGLFTGFSSIVFTSSVVNYGKTDISDMKDAFFFFLLLIDLNKAGVLAQLALSARSQEEIGANIAKGMSLLGPSITLDTLVEILLIGIGSLSGVRRLETLCGFACLGVIVNYFVFMTFYPACLSLFLESKLSRNGNGSSHSNSLKAEKILMMHSLNEEDQKLNPVVERVKLIMIVGLFVVHAHSRWPYRNDVGEEPLDEVSPVNPNILVTNRNKTEVPPDFKEYLMNWLSVSAENIVILIVLLALAVKLFFFEDKEEITKQLRFKQECEEPRGSICESEPMQTSRMEGELNERFAAMRTSSRSAIFPLSGVGGDWIEDEVQMIDKEVQTDDKNFSLNSSSNDNLCPGSETLRTVEECLTIYRSELGANALTDKEVIELVKHKYIQAYLLEKAVGDMERGVGIRRLILGNSVDISEDIHELPYRNYDYSKVLGSCCENIIGYVPVPVGIAGPLLVDGESVYVPMATTEGCLVASTNRGSRALLNGVTSRVVSDGMTRGPMVRFPGIERASEAKAWMEDTNNYLKMKASFDETSRFARLNDVQVRIAGRLLFIRFVATTGDAMGMNMLSKGTEKSLRTVQEKFPDMEILSLSGNFCTDKKPAAVNWIEGRGKGVVCEAVVPSEIVSTVLKTTVHAIVDVNINKNLVGSAVAGSIGGNNAHAANIVTAIYIATGQDPAQNVGSSNCMTLMEPCGPDGTDLYVSCTMPSIEIGTIGGGTGLPAQGACLAMLGVKGANSEEPGKNSSKLARIVCATVLAGELSLVAALAAGHLVKSHLRHNRSSTTVSNPVNTPPTLSRSQVAVSLTVPSIQPVCTNASRGS